MITFKGYKNIITNDIQFSRDSRMAFISMQLNDEGTPDLTEFKKVKEMSFIQDDSDVFTMMYGKFKHMPEKLFFNSKSLYLGEELSSLREECGDTYNYKREENASMNAYTLMASLTKRMRANSQYIVDGNLGMVFQSLLMFFSDSLRRNPREMYEFLHNCVRNGEPLNKTASFFNDFIDINMKKFFKL